MEKRILVVDDEPDIIKVVVFRLKKAGYKIVEVENGKEALDALRHGEKIDLVLLDLIMPVMDGYQCCRALKADADWKDIPVIVLSAESGQDIREKAKQLQADDFIVKPFDTETLIAKIRKLTGE